MLAFKMIPGLMSLVDAYRFFSTDKDLCLLHKFRYLTLTDYTFFLCSVSLDFTVDPIMW